MPPVSTIGARVCSQPHGAGTASAREASGRRDCLRSRRCRGGRCARWRWGERRRRLDQDRLGLRRDRLLLGVELSDDEHKCARHLEEDRARPVPGAVDRRIAHGLQPTFFGDDHSVPHCDGATEERGHWRGRRRDGVDSVHGERASRRHANNDECRRDDRGDPPHSSQPYTRPARGGSCRSRPRACPRSTRSFDGPAARSAAAPACGSSPRPVA